MVRELEIQPAKEGKGRSFRTSLVSYVTANSLWSGGSTGTDTTRPIWMMLAGSESELRPFVANLQTGRKAELRESAQYRRSKPLRIETLKSAGYQFAWQRTPMGAVVTCFLTKLFRLDPGMVDPAGIEFCILPTSDWLVKDEKAKDYLLKCGAKEAHLDQVVALAPVFIAYLDRRTRCPLVPDSLFYAQVLYAALSLGLASWSTPVDTYFRDLEWGQHKHFTFHEFDTEVAGLSRGLVFQATHASLETFLAEQVSAYFEQVGRG